VSLKPHCRKHILIVQVADISPVARNDIVGLASRAEGDLAMILSRDRFVTLDAHIHIRRAPQFIKIAVQAVIAAPVCALDTAKPTNNWIHTRLFLKNAYCHTWRAAGVGAPAAANWSACTPRRHGLGLRHARTDWSAGTPL